MLNRERSEWKSKYEAIKNSNQIAMSSENSLKNYEHKHAFLVEELEKFKKLAQERELQINNLNFELVKERTENNCKIICFNVFDTKTMN